MWSKHRRSGELLSKHVIGLPCTEHTCITEPAAAQIRWPHHLNLGDLALACTSFRIMSKSYSLRCSWSDSV